MTWPFDADPNQAANAPAPADQSGGGMFTPGSFLDNPTFRRHAAYDALTNAGLGLIAASAPSATPTNLGTMFGALAGGAAQGVQGSADRYMKQMQMAAQMQNMQMRQRMMSTPLPAPQDPGEQPQAPQQAGGPVAPAQQQTAADESGNNPQAVNPTSGAAGKYQFMPETWAGVATKHPELKLPFNPKQATEEQQDAAKAAFDKDNAQGLAAFNIPGTDANLYLAHRFGVGGATQFLQQPPDTQLASFMPKTWIDQNKDLQGKTVGQFKRAVDQRYPGTQLAQAGGNPQIAQGDGPQVAPGQPQPPATSQGGGIQLPPMPKPIPYSPMAQRYIASGDKGLEALGKANNEQVDRINARNMERWKQNAELLRHNQTEARERQGMTIRQQNADIGPDGLPNQNKIDFKTQEKKAERTADAEATEQHTFGGHGWENVPNDQFRKMANPKLINLADGLQNGTVRLSTLSNSPGRGGTVITKEDVQAAGMKLYGDKWNPDAGDVRHKFEQDIKDTDTQIGKTVYSINTVNKHIDRFQDLVLAQENGDTPLVNSIRKQLNDQAGYNKYSSAEALQPALGTEIANTIKGAQLNEPEVDRAIDVLKTTKAPAQMLDALQTLRHAMHDRETTITEKAADAYVPKERIDRIIGPTAKAAIEHFDTTQTKYRAAHPEKFGGQPNAPVAPSMDAINAEMKRRGLVK